MVNTLKISIEACPFTLLVRDGAGLEGQEFLLQAERSR